jgi:DNA repair exonuclease SbcCD ATPase subunit
MKKIMFVMVVLSSMLFANNVDLNSVLQKLDMLEKKVSNNEKEISELKTKLKKKTEEMEKNAKKYNIFEAVKCDYISVSDLKYRFIDDLIDAYSLNFNLKNDYDYDIKYINGDLEAYDKDKVRILNFNLLRDINVKSKETQSVKAHHPIESELEYYLKDENPKNLTIKFKVRKIIFQNGRELNCH